jgi:transposase-like protein
MSKVREEEFKRWTARRKAALVMEIFPGKTTVVEASGPFDTPSSKIEEWVGEGCKEMENVLRDVRERCERQLKELQEAYGEAMLELRVVRYFASTISSCNG